MAPFRHQLAGYSPLPFSAVLKGAGALLPGAGDPRESLLRVLSEHTGAGAGWLTDSGTSALRLALELLAERRRTPVALPAFSCYDVATAAVGAGTPVLVYDLDPTTLSPKADSLEEALAAGARSVVVASLFGFPVNWDAVRTAASRHGAVVVEDAAQAHGSTFRGSSWGRHGDLVVWSFGRGKGWTGGGGGALLAGSSFWEEALSGSPPSPGPVAFGELRHLAATAGTWLLGRPGVYGLPRAIPLLGLGETRYRKPHRARRIPATAAGIAAASRLAAEEEVARRQSAAREYRTQLDEWSYPGPAPRPVSPVEDGESGYLRFPVLIEDMKRDPDAVLAARARRLGAERSYPLALSDLPALHSLLPKGTVTPPGARKLSGQLITLPTHSRTRPDERLELVRTLSQVPLAIRPGRPLRDQSGESSERRR